jgi:hypothetical protein
MAWSETVLCGIGLVIIALPVRVPCPMVLPGQLYLNQAIWLSTGIISWSGRSGGLLLRGSHGAGHADVPHPALRSTASLRDGGRTDARLWQWISRK